MVILIGLACMIGCATGEWQGENVPLPRSTPFDSNQLARNAYLEGFREGYRAQNDRVTIETVDGPYIAARRQGFYAGAAQARAGGSLDIK